LKSVKIGICGLGTVGSGTFNVLKENADLVAARAVAPVEVVHVGARRDNPQCELGDTRVSRDIFAVANDPEVDVVVELIGGTTVARELVEAAIRSGKHVVTANKALIAEFGNELFALAEQHNVSIRYEAAVAGGIPIIKAMREGLAGNRIEWLAGIINGTGNFILTEMRDKGRDFADVLSEAQELGYAEADPTFDIEGIDAAHKLVILAAIAFGMPLQFSKVYTEGITKLTPQDVDYALILIVSHAQLLMVRYGFGCHAVTHSVDAMNPSIRTVPSVDPRISSEALSGCGMSPATLRPAFVMPAIELEEPFGLLT
jgi:homoserine dehydrogenase